MSYFCVTSVTPTKRSNAQHLIGYEKQLLYDENTKISECHAIAFGSYVCGINTMYELRKYSY